MRLAVVLFCVFLAGCASPDARFWGQDAREVQIEGRRYAVYLRTEGVVQPRVQVIRMGYVHRGDHEAVFQAMQHAAAQATGCRLIDGSVRGDSGVMTGRMMCP